MLLISDTSFWPWSNLDFVLLPPPPHLDPADLLYFFSIIWVFPPELTMSRILSLVRCTKCARGGGVSSIIIATPLVVYTKLSGKTKSAWMCNKTTKSNNNGEWSLAWDSQSEFRAGERKRGHCRDEITRQCSNGAVRVGSVWLRNRRMLKCHGRLFRALRSVSDDGSGGGGGGEKREKSGVSDLPLFDSHCRHRRCFGLQSTFSRCAVSKGAGAEAVSWLSLDSYQRDSSSGTRAGLKNLRAMSGVVERRA